MLRHLPAYAAALLVTAALAACGGGGSNEVVAMVGHVAIVRTTLDHWTAVLLGGGASPVSSAAERQAQRRRALTFLISGEWLIGEAGARGVAASGPEVRRRVDEREHRSFPGGSAELHEFLKVSGETVADMELEERVGLISSSLRKVAIAAAPRVTPTQVAAYYSSHPHAFVIPEAREVRLTNRKSAAGADRVLGEVKAGKSFAVLSSPVTIERASGVTATSPVEPLARAIYAARLNVLTGPIKQGPDYNLIEVKRVQPARRETLRQASGAIARQLREASVRRALAAAVDTWRTRWRAITSCRPGYVVQKCWQYSGPNSAEDPLAFN